MGANLVPAFPLRRLFRASSPLYFSIILSFQLAAVCALRSGRTERRTISRFLCAKSAGFYTFQLAAVCALRSGRTERRMTAGFYPFQLAAVCALHSGRMERRMTAGFKGVS